MTAITPGYQLSSTASRPPMAMLVLLALAAVAVVGQAALSASMHAFTAEPGLTKWFLLGIHFVMFVLPLTLGIWAYQGLTGVGAHGTREAARRLAHFLRSAAYVAVVATITTWSFESTRFTTTGGLINVLWFARTASAVVLVAAAVIYVSRSAAVRAAYGHSFAGQVADVQMLAVSRDAAICVLLMLASLLTVLTKAAIPSIREFGWSFITTSDWRPNALPGGPKLDADGNAMRDPDTGETMMNPEVAPAFGALPLIWGTAVSSLLAVLVAVPLSFGAALFLVRVAPELRPVVFLYFLLGLCFMGVLVTAAVWTASYVGYGLGLAILAIIFGEAVTITLAGVISHNVIQNVTPERTIQTVKWVAVAGIFLMGTFLIWRLIGLSPAWSVLIGLLASLTVWLIAPQVTAAVSFLVEFLAAVPSIAYGIWGIFVLAPFLQQRVEPAFVWVYDHLPVVGWGHMLLIVGGPVLALFVAWLVYRFSPPSMKRSMVFVTWGVLLVVGLLSLTLGLTFGYKGVPVLASLDAFLQAHLHCRPSTWWLFAESSNEGGAVTYRNVALTGNDMLCGGLILAIMIIPIITAISRDVLTAVPRAQIEGTTALGATWWQSSKEMLKFSRSALFGAVMLGLARAAGETMAVTMVIGNNPQIKFSPFMAAQTMSSLLANQFAEANTTQRAALFEVALILLVMSLAFNVVARYLVVGKNSRSAAAH